MLDSKTVHALPPRTEGSEADKAGSSPPANYVFVRAKSGLGWALCLTAAMAGIGFLAIHIEALKRINPAVIAMVIGVLIGMRFKVSRDIRQGLSILTRISLRIAIVLLGFQLNLSMLLSIGLGGLVAVVVAAVSCFAVTILIGRMLKVDPRLTDLIAVGTSICGASAILAANTVTKADDEDVAYALAVITLYGTVAMISYPILAMMLDLGSTPYGVWVGASIHEIAQVMVAGFQVDTAAGEVAIVSKLGRVLLLAPVVLLLSVIVARRQSLGKSKMSAPVPWFIVGFTAAVAVSSYFSLTPTITELLRNLTGFLLAMVLAGIGLTISFRELKYRGFRPLLLGGLATIFISVASLGLLAISI